MSLIKNCNYRAWHFIQKSSRFDCWLQYHTITLNQERRQNHSTCLKTCKHNYPSSDFAIQALNRSIYKLYNATLTGAHLLILKHISIYRHDVVFETFLSVYLIYLHHLILSTFIKSDYLSMLQFVLFGYLSRSMTLLWDVMVISKSKGNTAKIRLKNTTSNQIRMGDCASVFFQS